MAEKGNQHPTADSESDISKAQAAQQPQSQAGQQPEPDQDQEQPEGQPDEGLQGETATRQRTDIEGTSQPQEKGEAESGFVGSESDQDTSSELVEDEDEDFARGDGE